MRRKWWLSLFINIQIFCAASWNRRSEKSFMPFGLIALLSLALWLAPAHSNAQELISPILKPSQERYVELTECNNTNSYQFRVVYDSEFSAHVLLPTTSILSQSITEAKANYAKLKVIGALTSETARAHSNNKCQLLTGVTTLPSLHLNPIRGQSICQFRSCVAIFVEALHPLSQVAERQLSLITKRVSDGHESISSPKKEYPVLVLRKSAKLAFASIYPKGTIEHVYALLEPNDFRYITRETLFQWSSKLKGSLESNAARGRLGAGERMCCKKTNDSSCLTPLQSLPIEFVSDIPELEERSIILVPRDSRWFGSSIETQKIVDKICDGLAHGTAARLTGGSEEDHAEYCHADELSPYENWRVVSQKNKAGLEKQKALKIAERIVEQLLTTQCGASLPIFVLHSK